MTEKWHESIDTRVHAGGFLTDLFKEIDCIDRELLIGKINAYVFDTHEIKFVYCHPRGRKQRPKINSSYSSFAEILFDVSQQSIFGSRLCNAYICHLFYDIDELDFANLMTILHILV